MQIETATRKLKVTYSNVSVDSEGYPLLCCSSTAPSLDEAAHEKEAPRTPEPTSSACARSSGSEALKPGPSNAAFMAGLADSPLSSEAVLQALMASPVPPKKQMARARAIENKAVLKRPAISKAKPEAGLPYSYQNQALGRLKLVKGCKQSYIQHMDAAGAWRLVVAVSQTMTGQHQQVAQKLLLEVLAHNMDKSQALAARERLLQA